MLRVEADDAVGEEAQRYVLRILEAVTDPRVRSAFEESETVQHIISQRRERPAVPGGLSAREIEVLRLIALGKSNAQIAEELTISINTVQRHVGNIFGKTGVANRTEAAAFANRAGLLAD
jgi:DNA-binding NarL/FixJ family response regulator